MTDLLLKGEKVIDMAPVCKPVVAEAATANWVWP
jgi:hypothetical protein